MFGCQYDVLCRNSKGYEMAKKFNSKFTHLSPVWYDLKRYVHLIFIIIACACFKTITGFSECLRIVAKSP